MGILIVQNMKDQHYYPLQWFGKVRRVAILIYGYMNVKMLHAALYLDLAVYSAKMMNLLIWFYDSVLILIILY